MNQLKYFLRNPEMLVKNCLGPFKLVMKHPNDEKFMSPVGFELVNRNYALDYLNSDIISLCFDEPGPVVIWNDILNFRHKFKKEPQLLLITNSGDISISTKDLK